MLDKRKIKQAFEALNTKLREQGISGDIVIFGGAYMVLVLDTRVATKDVDAIFKPATDIRKAVLEVAESLNLPEDWLNDGVKGFLPSKGNEKGSKMMNFSNLKIWTPKAEYILAMKCMASRSETKDLEDIRNLINYLNLKTSEEVYNIVMEYYPVKTIPTKIQYIIEEIFE